MNNFSLQILGIACGIFGVICILYEMYYIKLYKLNTISIVRLFYSIIYGITPASIYIYVNNNMADGNLRYINFDEVGIRYLWIGFILSILSYITINIGYKSNKYFRISYGIKSPIYSYRGIYISGVILLAIGTISLFMWTKVYGGPLGILPYANALRAGWEVGIYNPFSFLMKLCPFALFASYIFWMLFLKEKKIKLFFMFSFSAIISFLYLLACSSRTMFALYFLVLIVLYERIKEIKTGKKTKYIKYFFVSLCALIVANIGESIMGFFQNTSVKDLNVSFNVFKILRDEFFFISENLQIVQEARSSGLVGYRLFEDMICGIFAWLPSRFLPNGLQKLETLNTILKMGTTIYGGLPTDFVTTSLYELGYFGIVVIPFVFGRIIKKFEIFIKRHKDETFYLIIQILGSFYIIKAVAYADFANIMSNIFYVVFGYLCVKVICMFTNSKNTF